MRVISYALVYRPIMLVTSLTIPDLPPLTWMCMVDHLPCLFMDRLIMEWLLPHSVSVAVFYGGLPWYTCLDSGCTNWLVVELFGWQLYYSNGGWAIQMVVELLRQQLTYTMCLKANIWQLTTKTLLVHILSACPDLYHTTVVYLFHYFHTTTYNS